jgi:hypothetical protein
MSGSKYLGWCLSLTFFLVAVAAAINYVADPCGIYHYGKRWDWIHSRPAILGVAFIHKARAVEQAQADVLFLGSSRTAEGLDPHNPVVPGRAYNLGLPDSSVYEQWRYFQHACAAHMPNTVVLGIDMGGFAATRKNNAMFLEDRLLVRPDGTPTPFLSRTFADLGPTIFSLSTVELSLKTLEVQRGPALKFDEGFEANAPLITEHLDLAKSVFAANNKWVTNATTILYRGPDGGTPQMDAFDHLVAFCAEKHIRLIVFLQPLHSAALDNFTREWDAYADWEKALVTRMESHPGLQGEFWDFASYNSMSTEPFPLPTDKYSHMRYYWEGSHYRKIVGDMVLERIFTGAGPAAFGRQINSSTVDQDLQRLLDEKLAWHEHHQAVAIDISTAEVQANP